MIRLYVLVEGQTEQAVANRLLAPHLHSLGVDAHFYIVETSRDAYGRKRRGGGSWAKWRRDLRLVTGQQKGDAVRFSTLFDLYGLPDDFPGLTTHGNNPDTLTRVRLLEEAMLEEIADKRLIPYLQRHEFEALVFAALTNLENLFDAPSDVDGIKKLKGEVGAIAPEDINGGPATAPSKRLKNSIPSYRKTVHGPMAIQAAGLSALREACPRFDRWLKTLESLAPTRLEA